MIDYIKYGMSVIAILLIVFGMYCLGGADKNDSDGISGATFFCSGFIGICVIWF